MKAERMLKLVVIFWVSLTLIVACNSTAVNPGNSSATTELTVSAATSLKDAMAAIKPLYQAENSDVKIIYNLASSGSLQQQIEQGAPVDVFISAAPKQMNALEEKGLLLEGTRTDLLQNKMVLIVPNNDTSITSFKDLSGEKVDKFAMGEPESVPAGKYAREVLTSEGIFDSLQPKIVYAKDVRQVLSYVATGNTNAGIVYSSDAQISDSVKIVETASEDSYSPVIYPIAVLKESKHPDAAQAFVEFLSSSIAQPVFEQYGFTTVTP